MGFYGNITNAVRSSFYFDRTYPNRKAMDDNCDKDGVFIGRYVLVNYEENNTYIPLIPDKQPVPPTPSVDEDEEKLKEDGETTILALAASDGEQGSDEIFKDEENTEMVKTENYIKNYNLDIDTYGPSRGYDSTVWQKTYADGKQKYVMIAELNTVVPTFALKADPPTTVPLKPHFDIDSTNVYYLLHYQPSWGFRVRPANKKNYYLPIIGENGTQINFNPSYYWTYVNDGEKEEPSDESIVYTTSMVDNKGNKKEYFLSENTWYELTGDVEPTKTPAAIYYNKKGFDKTINTKSAENISDTISMSLGYSGQIYQTHNLKNEPVPEFDTQQLTINLPSIGDTISEVWDIVYGEGEENKDEELERNLDISWENAPDALALIGNRDQETLAGSINSVSDLTGMIVFDSLKESVNLVYDRTDDMGSVMDKYIYLAPNGKYYFKKYAPYLVPVDTLNPVVATAAVNIDTSSNYWFKNFRGNYIKETEYDPTRKYYNVSLSNPVRFDNDFDYTKFFVFNKETGIYSQASKKDEGPFYQITRTDTNLVIYAPEDYFKEDNGQIVKLTKDNTDPFDEKGIYYHVPEEDLELIIKRTPYYDANGNPIKDENGFYKIAITYQLDLLPKPIDEYLVDNSMIKGGFEGAYYFSNNSYIPLTEENYSRGTSYCIITVKEQNIGTDDGSQLVDYEPNMYWFEDNGNYIKEYLEKPRKGKTFYKTIAANAFAIIDFKKTAGTICETEMVQLVSNCSGSAANGYTFTPSQLYVVSDRNGAYIPGEPFIEEVIPEGVTVGYIRDRYVWEELVSYGVDLSTINGLILALYKNLFGVDIYSKKTLEGILQDVRNFLAWAKREFHDLEEKMNELYNYWNGMLQKLYNDWNQDLDDLHKYWDNDLSNLHETWDNDLSNLHETWNTAFEELRDAWDDTLTEFKNGWNDSLDALYNDLNTDLQDLYNKWDDEIDRQLNSKPDENGDWGDNTDTYAYKFFTQINEWNNEFTEQLTEEKDEDGEYRTDTWAGRVGEKVNNLEITNNTWNTTLSDTNDKWDDTLSETNENWNNELSKTNEHWNDEFSKQLTEATDEEGNLRDDTWAGQAATLMGQMQDTLDANYVSQVIQLQEQVAALEETVENLKKHVAKIVNIDATDVTDDNYNEFFEVPEVNEEEPEEEENTEEEDGN